MEKLWARCVLNNLRWVNLNKFAGLWTKNFTKTDPHQMRFPMNFLTFEEQVFRDKKNTIASQYTFVCWER